MSVREKTDEIKKAAGVPKDEPIFLLRGKDKHALSVIARYVIACDGQGERPPQEFMDDLVSLQIEFEQFRQDHPDRMKTPD
jgi:hypothetical protein